jgi:hypothetical protein
MEGRSLTPIEETCKSLVDLYDTAAASSDEEERAGVRVAARAFLRDIDAAFAELVDAPAAA